MASKNYLIIIILFTLASCAHVNDNYEIHRIPADTPNTCMELAQNLFLKDNYEED